MIDKFIKGNKYRVIHDSESKFNDGDIVVALENDDDVSYCALYTSDFDISKHGIAYLLKIEVEEYEISKDKPMSIQEFENNAKKYFGNKDCLKRECKTCIFSNSDKPLCCFHTQDFIESEKRLRKWLKDDDKIKVGDMVKIVDDELIYSTSIDRVIEMVDELDIPEEIKKRYLTRFAFNKKPNTDFNYKVLVIKNIGNWSYTLISESYCNGCVYLINTNGLKISQELS